MLACLCVRVCVCVCVCVKEHKENITRRTVYAMQSGVLVCALYMCAWRGYVPEPSEKRCITRGDGVCREVLAVGPGWSLRGLGDSRQHWRYPALNNHSHCCPPTRPPTPPPPTYLPTYLPADHTHHTHHHTHHHPPQINMRQLCFHRLASAAGKAQLWWDYATRFAGALARRHSGRQDSGRDRAGQAQGSNLAGHVRGAIQSTNRSFSVLPTCSPPHSPLSSGFLAPLVTASRLHHL